MKQDKVDQLSEQANYKSTPAVNTEELAWPQDNLRINIQETEDLEVGLTFQRRPQYRINENSRRRFD